MDLLHVIYVSTLNVSDAQAELARILEASHRNNGAVGVTGMLLLAGRNVMQVLEGEPAAVDTIYRRVCQDPRHSQIFEILREPIARRDFALWSMGFHELSEADSRLLPEHAPWFESGFRGSAIQARPGVALELLRQFSRNNY